MRPALRSRQAGLLLGSFLLDLHFQVRSHSESGKQPHQVKPWVTQTLISNGALHPRTWQGRYLELQDGFHEKGGSKDRKKWQSLRTVRSFTKVPNPEKPMWKCRRYMYVLVSSHLSLWVAPWTSKPLQSSCPPERCPFPATTIYTVSLWVSVAPYPPGLAPGAGVSIGAIRDPE